VEELEWVLALDLEVLAMEKATVPNHQHTDRVHRRCKATMTAHCWRKARKPHLWPRRRCQGQRRTQSNLHKLPASAACGHWQPRGER